MTALEAWPVIASSAEKLSISQPKLNTALEALADLNAGAGNTPAAPRLHQFWADTDGHRIKQRNAANGAWKSLWELDATPVANVVRPVTAHHSPTVNQGGVFYCDATAGAITFTMPDAASCQGMFYGVIKTDVSANAVTVTRAGSDTFEGATTIALAAQYNKTALISDGGATWYKWFGV